MICIDEKICFNHGMNPETALLLQAIILYRPISQYTYKNAISKGFLSADKDTEGNYCNLQVTDKGKELLTAINENSLSKKFNVTKAYTEIAEAMRELYPAGKKPGTAYMWRDSTPLIAARLKKVFESNKIEPDKEAILRATKSYVDSFKGNNTYMQLLKYFILKDNESQLLSYLANVDNLDEEGGGEWTTTLR